MPAAAINSPQLTRRLCALCVSRSFVYVTNNYVCMCMRPCVCSFVSCALFPRVSEITHPPTHQPLHPSIHPSVRPSVRPSVHPSIHPSIHPPTHPSTNSAIHPPINQSVRPSVLPATLQP